MSKLIITDKEIMGGEPVIKGTRITASTIKQQFRKANGSPFSYLGKLYPHLKIEEIQAARKFKSPKKR